VTKARIKPANWGIGERLTSAQGNAWDAYWPDVIDGAGGGTWSPSSVISIGGSGIQITGPAEFQGDVVIDNVGSTNSLSVGGNVGIGGLVTIGDTLTVAAKATFNGDTEFNGQNQFDDICSFTSAGFVTFSGTNVFDATSSIDFQAGLIVSAGTLSALGATSLAAATAVSLGVAGVIVLDATTLSTTSAVTATFAGPVNVANTLTISSGALVFSGVGSPRYRVVNTADASAVTYTINDGDLFMLPALGGNRTYTLGTTGATEGARVRFSAELNTTTNYATINGGALFLMHAATGTLWLDFVFHSGSWMIEAYYNIP
jgi:hypothetical protein